MPVDFSHGMGDSPGARISSTPGHISMTRFLITSALIGALMTTTAAARERYQCIVQDFIGFGDDAAFKAANKRKTFDLTIDKDEIIALSKSRDFDDSEKHYRIHERDLLDTIALGKEVISGLDSLVLPSNPEDRIDRKGHFNATIALQSSFYLNTWLLRCTR